MRTREDTEDTLDAKRHIEYTHKHTLGDTEIYTEKILSNDNESSVKRPTIYNCYVVFSIIDEMANRKAENL